MRRKGEVDGMAGATAFFHRGLCPLCGGGFRRCRFETLLFTPTEERRQMPSGLPPLRLWRGKDCKKRHPGEPGVFLLFWEVQRGIRLCGDCAGEKGLWHSDPAHRGRQGTAPRRGSAARALPPFQNLCRRAAHRNYSLFILHSSLISSLPIPCYNRP